MWFGVQDWSVYACEETLEAKSRILNARTYGTARRVLCIEMRQRPFHEPDAWYFTSCLYLPLSHSLTQL